MKKILFISLIAISSALSFTSCTEEEVMPATDKGTYSNGGGGMVGSFN